MGIVLLRTWLQVEDGVKPFALSKAIGAAHLVLRLYCTFVFGFCEDSQFVPLVEIMSDETEGLDIDRKSDVHLSLTHVVQISYL